ncbi:MAG: sodium:solute symporter [Bacteroidetes bacterium]|nr:MAG: sodium:solute symporter [Bacteroidota bacterium]
MSTIDWIILVGTTAFIVIYGIWKSRGATNIRGYLLANQSQKWWTIGLSIMATQASAITFLSTPGQAFDDGMRFVQFYFGVPIAMVLISLVAIPIFRRLNVYTAYEYLEGRFDLKTRSLAAILFLISRSLASGITIVAPAIIFSTILGWDLTWTCVAIGLAVMTYTVLGGTRAVSQTQQQQMAVILSGMIIAAVIMILKLPPDVSFGDAVGLAGKMGKLNTLTLPDSFEGFIKDRYNILSGLVAGTFLMLSYFGTDQSQVQRYLGGKSVAEIRIGLLFNGMLKVPMQFGILFIGAMMFVFYQFHAAPMFFNKQEAQSVLQSEYGPQYEAVEQRYQELTAQNIAKAHEFVAARQAGDTEAVARHQEELMALQQQKKAVRQQGIALIQQHNPHADVNDLDRVFLTFVLTHLPRGLVGLLIAVILAAAMSSTSAELNALASTTVVDIYKRFRGDHFSPAHYLHASKLLTFFWGLVAIAFAVLAGNFENLIEYVNILGSLFYGTILGIFVVAFFFKQVGGTATFLAALLAEAIVVAMFALPQLGPDTFSWDIGFLWYNFIGCMCVLAFAFGFHYLGLKRAT